MQTQDSGARAELLAPPVQTSGEYLDEWLAERALERTWGVFEPVPSFLAKFRIITHDRSGTPRPDKSAERLKFGDVRYKNPAGSGVVIYAPKPDSFARFAAAKEKWIAEGQGKVLALVGLGLPALGIGGCEMWHPSGDSSRLHPDLEDHIRKGDVVNVVMDGDFREKERVRVNAGLLLFHLRAIGAKPRLLNLAADQKIDDLIASWRRAGKDPKGELDAIGFLDHVPSPIALTEYQSILERPPQPWIVKNVVPPGELTAIVGETSCGKTFLTMDLLLAVARGQSHWFGQRIKRTGLVVHITLEGTGLGNRLRAYHQHHKLAGSLPYLALELPLNLRDDETTDNVIRSITDARNRTGKDVVLIAVDTVNRAIGGGDENSSVDMGAFLANCERIKAAFPGCGVLLVHHVGKDPSKGARGHSSFSANVGAELSVENDERSGIRTVRMTKQREASTALQFGFALATVGLGRDEDGDEITSCVVQPAAPPIHSGPTDRDIYNEMRAQWVTNCDANPISHDYLWRNNALLKPKGMKTTRNDLSRVFKLAVAKGWAVPEGGTGNGERYRLEPPAETKY